MSGKLYLIALVTFLAIDLIWLTLIAKKFYAQNLGSLLSPTVNWPAALIFYLLFIAGIVILVIQPALDQQSWSKALLNGALLGLISYATYDLTNLATINHWPLLVTIIDLIWGTVLTAATSTITFLLAQKIGL